MTFEEFAEYIARQFRENPHAASWTVTNPDLWFYPYGESIELRESR